MVRRVGIIGKDGLEGVGVMRGTWKHGPVRVLLLHSL